MKYGKKTIKQFSQIEKDTLLSDIIENCILFAGDSYEDFSRVVVRRLVEEGLVDYGE